MADITDIELPGSSDPIAVPVQQDIGAFIINPLFGKKKITALEALNVISLFSSVLVSSEACRAALKDGRVFNGK